MEENQTIIIRLRLIILISINVLSIIIFYSPIDLGLKTLLKNCFYADFLKHLYGYLPFYVIIETILLHRYCFSSLFFFICYPFLLHSIMCLVIYLFALHISYTNGLPTFGLL